MTGNPRGILHIIDTTGPGGAETVFVELGSHFGSEPWRSWAVVGGRGWAYDALAARGVQPLIVSPTGRGFDVRYLSRLATLVRRLPVDVVQSHLLSPAVYGVLAAALGGVPVVATFHGAWDLATEGRLGRIKRSLLRKRLFRAVFVSASLQRTFERAGYTFPAERAVVIHNGVDFERMGGCSREDARARLGLAPGEIVIGAVGNLRPAKSYDVLLSAAACVRRELPQAPVRFVVAGDVAGAQGEALLQQRDTMGLREYVTFLGFREDVWDVLAALDVYVSTSQSEGFSLTAVQALAAGVPAVATRSGGPEEIVVDGQTGFLVEVGSAPALASALVCLVRDSGLRGRMGGAGPGSVTNRFSIGRMLAGYDRLYLEAVSQRRGRQVG
jgi:glycosyltransferase involved in cell wall biosynthesis